MKFNDFRKIPRLNRDIIISEKIDGSNAQIYIVSDENILKSESEIPQYYIAQKDNLYMFVGSRTRWLNLGKESDNYGFAQWVKENNEELFKLGEGQHFGEWYGKGINRNYGLPNRRFALFNTSKWIKKTETSIPPLAEKQQYCPNCCEVVPEIYIGEFNTEKINSLIEKLKTSGSVAVPGYLSPEGLIVYHTASKQYFKVTCENDAKWKNSNEG